MLLNRIVQSSESCVKLPTLWYQCLLSCRRQWDERELERIQAMRLRNLLEYAALESEFYRNTLRQADVERVTSSRDLARIPMLSREALMANLEGIITSRRQTVHGKSRSTSGSTGCRLNVLNDNRFVLSQYVRQIRQWLSCGVRPGQSHLFLMQSSGSSEVGRLRSRLDTRLMNRIWLLFTSLPPLEEELWVALRLLEQKQITLLYAPPFLLGALADLKSSSSNKTRGPRIIVTGSELLHAGLRRHIEMSLGVRVLDGYALTEVGSVAWQCVVGDGYHVDADEVILETVEGGQPIWNKPGEIVVTNLSNYAMPLIRYRTGDVGILTDRQCSCGRALPILVSIEGRLRDHVVCADGRELSPREVARVVGNIVGARFHVVQESADTIRVGLPGMSQDEATTAGLRKALSCLMGPGVRIIFETSDQTGIVRGLKQAAVTSKCHALHGRSSASEVECNGEFADHE